MGSNKCIITKIKCWPVFKQDPTEASPLEVIASGHWGEQGQPGKFKREEREKERECVCSRRKRGSEGLERREREQSGKTCALVP